MYGYSFDRDIFELAQRAMLLLDEQVRKVDQSVERLHNSIVLSYTQKYIGVAVTSIWVELALRKSLVLGVLSPEIM